MKGESLAAATLGGEEPVETMLLKKEADGNILVLTPPEYAGLPAFDAPPDGPLVMAANSRAVFMPDVRDPFRDGRCSQSPATSAPRGSGLDSSPPWIARSPSKD